jgi:hypothetical protein
MEGAQGIPGEAVEAKDIVTNPYRSEPHKEWHGKNDVSQEMKEARFTIRRDVEDDFHHWSLRDALCKNVETHDFSGTYWVESCTGACDTFKFWSSAIGTAEANR